MNPLAVLQARERLEKAKRALTRLESSMTFGEAEEAWTDFLLSASAVFSKLEQGSKTSGSCVAWYGRVKHRRKNDPVLKYIHFARNCDEHGVARIVDRTVSNPILLNSPIGTRETKELTLTYHPLGKPLGEKMIVHMYGKHLVLLRVTDDRFSDFADPPDGAMDKWKDSRNPLDVGQASLPALEDIIQEAAARPA